MSIIGDTKIYIAHVSEDNRVQALETHLQETAMISQQIGEKMAIGKVCYLAGLLHDAGKYSDAFQAYIKSASEGEEVKRGSVDHSTYGGQLILEMDANTKFEMLALEMIANAVFTHHSSAGLLDFISGEGTPKSDFTDRSQKELDEYQQVKNNFFKRIISEDELREIIQQCGEELALLAKNQGEISRTDQFFLTKIVYSALLDGDRRNTHLFETNLPLTEIDAHEIFKRFRDHLEEKFDQFRRSKPTLINQLRQQMADKCLETAASPTGIYRLSIPTGGGKTLASMRFALNHALHHGKQRIIYVIPFSSVIEQNAAVFREVLKDETHILEHHSNLVLETDDESEESERRQALMEDNWDAPIIVTTMVRFLENVFAGSTRNPRRIHQLVNSILIFDEIQSIPPKTMALFNTLITFLQNYGNTTTLLCTATQPTLENREIPLPIKSNAEIVPNLAQVSHSFERVKIIDKCTEKGWDAQQLADFAEEILTQERNLLMILNTKKAVRSVYHELADKGYQVYHLSTAMVPNHRLAVLNEIRKKLDAKEKIICITTPLIEAGVDISFASVIRSVSGLDSIAQAAGRCNRNGESASKQPVYLVNLIKALENMDRLKEIKTKQRITWQMLKDRRLTQNSESLLAPQPMYYFFEKFFKEVDKTSESKYLINKGSQNLFDLMDKNSVRRKFFKTTTGRGVPTYSVSSTRTIAKHFEVIEQQTKSVLVEYDIGADLIVELTGSKDVIFDKKWYQKAQQFSLNLYDHEFQSLARDQMIHLTEAGIYILSAQAYDENFGLNVQGDSKTGSPIF